jgi:oxygen-independent coproporphyrinogen-3 oxidase
MSLISLYIHIPFCIHRCGYCDFNTFAGIQELIPAYSQALCEELEIISASIKNPFQIHTIYFGGGTPSLIPVTAMAQILATVYEHFPLIDSPEITLEANPGTISANYLAKVQRLGVNRISLGMQSANQHELTLLERQHTYDDVIRAVQWIRNTGDANINLDLIFGLPEQTLSSWMTSLEAALSLQPEHFSLYALTLESGTPLQHKVLSGLITNPDPDLAADMYEAAAKRLSTAGFVQYEISNWAQRQNDCQYLACIHNMQYWRNLPYLGVGAGAHGYIDHFRTVNVAAPKAYINRLQKNGCINSIEPDQFPSTPATIQFTPIDLDTEIGETMMMGLRLVQEGVSASEFQQRFGINLIDRYGSQIDKLITLGLLEWYEGQTLRLRLTVKGRLLGNQVFREFI